MNENIHQSAWDQVETNYIPFVHSQFISLPRRIANGYNVTSSIDSYARILNSCANMLSMFINYELSGKSYYFDTDNQPMPF